MRLFYLIGCLCWMTAAFAVSPSTETIHPIQIDRSSSHFEVTLPSVPTAGYQWYLVEYNPIFITPVGSHYEPNNHDKNMVGGSGIEHWQFKIVSHPTPVRFATKIKFIYMRSWEQEVQETKEIMVVVP